MKEYTTESVTIQDVLQENPAIQITDYVNENGTYHITGFIDMQCSSGYANIIKIKNKALAVNCKTRNNLTEKEIRGCKTLKELVSLLNIRGILDTPDI